MGEACLLAQAFRPIKMARYQATRTTSATGRRPETAASHHRLPATRQPAHRSTKSAMVATVAPRINSSRFRTRMRLQWPRSLNPHTIASTRLSRRSARTTNKVIIKLLMAERAPSLTITRACSSTTHMLIIWQQCNLNSKILHSYRNRNWHHISSNSWATINNKWPSIHSNILKLKLHQRHASKENCLIQFSTHQRLCSTPNPHKCTTRAIWQRRGAPLHPAWQTMADKES